MKSFLEKLAVVVSVLGLVSLMCGCSQQSVSGHKIEHQIEQFAFAEQDSITITEVTGDVRRLVVGGTYSVKGNYILESPDQARIGVFVTTTANNGRSKIQQQQTAQLTRGSGEFGLSFQAVNPGQIHVSFYPVENGESFGGVYFGTVE